MISIIIYIIASVTCVSAYSWLECTNYDPASTDYNLIGNFDRARCKGYPRNFQKQFTSGFGIDTSYQWAGADCSRDKYNPDDYTARTPMATYMAGETIYLVHPAKTHVADICTNSYIPSESIKLFISSNTTVDAFDIELDVLGGDHVNGRIDHLGYQRCYDFCNNIDKATCITGWTLPKTLSSGVHSFRWTWEIIPGRYFSTCFDASITGQASNNSNDDIIKISDTNGIPSTSIIILNDKPIPAVSTPMPISKTENPTETPVIIRKSTPEVITSAGNKINSPVTNITQYIIKIASNLSISGILNITEFKKVINLL